MQWQSILICCATLPKIIIVENVGALDLHIDGMVGDWGPYNWLEIEVISIFSLL